MLKTATRRRRRSLARLRKTGWRGHIFFWQRLRWPLLILAITFVLFLYKMFEPLELMTQDARFLLRGYRLATSDVVVVGMTQQCIDKIGEPIPRVAYAQAIENISSAGATLIGFDIFFRNEGSTPEHDLQLAEAMKNAGNVLLPVFSMVSLAEGEKGPVRKVDFFTQNIPLLRNVAVGQAHINIPPAVDLKCRSVPLALNFQGTSYFCYGIEAALTYMELKADAPEAVPVNLGERLRDIPWNRDGEYLINYYGQHVTFDFYSFQQVLDGEFPEDAFQGKLVLVGQTAPGQANADVIPTPLGSIYGVLVQGTIIDNILTGNFLRRQSVKGVASVLAVLTILSVLVFSRRNLVLNVMMFVLFLLVLLAASIYLFNNYDYTLELLPPLVLLSGNFAVALVLSLKETEEQVLRQGRGMATLVESSRLSANVSNDNPGQNLVRLVGETIGAQLVTLTLDKQNDCWHWTKSNGRREKEKLSFSAMRELDAAILQEFSQVREPVLYSDVAARASCKSHLADIQTLISVPLMARGMHIGQMNIYNKVPSSVSPRFYFSEDDLSLVAILTHQSALLLDNSFLIQDLAAKNKQLQESITNIKLMQCQLVEKEKLSAVGGMAAMIVHDMRGPITVAGGYAQLMQVIEDPEVQEYAAHILEQTRRVNDMAQEILDFASGEKKLSIATIHVPRMLQELMQNMHTEFRQAEIQWTCVAPNVGHIEGDKDKLLRMFVNLIRNAVKAMGGSGGISIRCEEMDNFVIFQISDSGPGIPEEIRETLFDAFVTHGTSRGTGLGLAIVKKIVQDHNGTISAQNAPGGGAVFEIRLPKKMGPLVEKVES